MPAERLQEYDAEGRLVSDILVEVLAAPLDPVEQLQAQVDALTDIVLGGAA